MKTLKDIETAPIDSVRRVDVFEIREAGKEWIDWLFEEAKKQPQHSHAEQCALAQAHILIQFLNLEGER